RHPRAMLRVLRPLLLGRAWIDLRIGRRLLGLRHVLALLERQLHVRGESQLAVRRKSLRAPQVPSVLDSERALLLVARRTGQVGPEILLVVVSVVLGDQAPSRIGRPPRAAEHPIDAPIAIAERQIDVAELLRCDAVGRAEDYGAAAKI